MTQGLLNSVFFGTYERVLKALGEDTPADVINYTHIAAAGAVGGAVQAIPCTPIELAKIKLQMQTGMGLLLALQIFQTC